MYVVSFIYSNLSLHCFTFSSFQGKFFLSPRTMDLFHLYHPRQLSFPSNLLIPYCLRVRPLVWIDVTIGNSIPSVCIFTIWRVAGWKRSMRRPPQIIMQNGPPFIIARSSEGGGLQGGVFNKFSNIYSPPTQKRPSSGDDKHILPLTGDAVALARAHAWLIPDWGVGVRVLSLESVCCNKGIATTHQKRLFILHAEHPRRAPTQKNTVRSWYVLGWCLCQYKMYGTIILTTISFRAYKDNYELWSFYHFIFEYWQSYCIITKASFELLVVLIFLQWSFFIHFVLCSWHPCNLTLLLFFFITNYPIIIFFQVINYICIKTIESEPIFGKS